MKTLKQVKAESAERRRLVGEKNQRDIECYLHAAKDWERPDEVDEERACRIRASVEEGCSFPIGIACDVCGFELAAEPGFSCMSSPPCRLVTCGVCGHHTTQSSRDKL